VYVSATPETPSSVVTSGKHTGSLGCILVYSAVDEKLQLCSGRLLTGNVICNCKCV